MVTQGMEMILRCDNAFLKKCSIKMEIVLGILLEDFLFLRMWAACFESIPKPQALLLAEAGHCEPQQC